MRIKNSVKTSLTRSGNLRITTRTKVPMFPAMRTSTTLGTASPPKRKRRKGR